MSRLDPIEAQRVSGILEETLEKLGFLGRYGSATVAGASRSRWAASRAAHGRGAALPPTYWRTEMSSPNLWGTRSRESSRSSGSWSSVTKA